ncbi:unnamed protein product [Adineta ricciae]|uniref:Uncharacterized protein n=1 Tax=Adineta ricciae TaxID=249248 RepID=A0A815CWY8_ADIRI|nr:unnamed protein product [Adineta ricciae]CAF1293475.1 unnamed protein product [Adineta ricciae]
MAFRTTNQHDNRGFIININPNPSPAELEHQSEIAQLNIEWRQAFQDLLEKFNKLEKQYIQDIVGLMIDLMVTKVEANIDSQKRAFSPDDVAEGRKKRARSN